MAVLTGNYENSEKPGQLISYLLGSGQRVFKGALCAIGTSGYLGKASDTASIKFAGIAYEEGNNTGGANGALAMRVKKTGTYVYRFDGAWSQAIVGQKAYAVDDNGVALIATTANDIYVGDIVALVGTDKVRIRIDNAVC